MTLPRAATEVLSGHVRLEVRCIDRLMLTFRQPRLQCGQGIHRFFCQHRGNQFVSSAERAATFRPTRSLVSACRIARSSEFRVICKDRVE